MKEIIVKPVERGRIWLPVQYGDQEIRFAYPSVQGTHQECFEAINKDPELRPAEGLELALLANAAYTNKQDEWTEILQSCFVSNYTRSPTRGLWLPKNSFGEDKSLSGVLLERDLQGKGKSTPMQIPNLAQWNQSDSGIYVASDNQSWFLPRDTYKLGDHTANSFAKDGFAGTVLTPEGAEIYARTAADARKIPFVGGLDVDKIQQPEQRVSVLDEDRDGLGLDGDGWLDLRNVRAFGVFAGAEGAKRAWQSN